MKATIKLSKARKAAAKALLGHLGIFLRMALEWMPTGMLKIKGKYR